MSKMNRRNVLLGLGTAAAGSGIVFGSGAFTQVEADRDLTIGVDNDSAGIIEINDLSDTDLIREDDEGDFVIDLDQINSTDNNGFNTNSKVRIGDVDDFGSPNEVNDPAFDIQSNFDVELGTDDEVVLEVELAELAEGSPDATFRLVLDAVAPDLTELEAADGSGDSVEIEGFEDGEDNETIQAAILIETGPDDALEFGGSGDEITLTADIQDTS